MKTIQLMSLLSVVFVVTAFSVQVDDETKNTLCHTYYGGGDTENPIVRLTLNDDNTFQYIDNSVATEKINIKGTWNVKRNIITLVSSDKSIKFHDRWKIDNQEKCLKSQKGITFYRLCFE